jgi:predicted nucleic-acid-binding Zn-ribbon protein
VRESFRSDAFCWVKNKRLLCWGDGSMKVVLEVSLDSFLVISCLKCCGLFFTSQYIWH